MVRGDAGDFAGISLCAGITAPPGACGIRPDAGMPRGSIALMKPVGLLSSPACSSAPWPVFPRFYLQRLRDCGFAIDDAHFAKRCQRCLGDGIRENRGGALVFDWR